MGNGLWFGLQIGFGIWNFGSNRRVFVRRSAGEQIISACVFPTVKHGGGGVIVWGCFAGDTVCELFRIQGTLNVKEAANFCRFLKKIAQNFNVLLVMPGI